MPSNIAYYVQYADILYTIGGTHAAGHRADVIANDYRTAQSYYAAAVRMSEGQNLRALYGLCASTSQLSGLKVLPWQLQSGNITHPINCADAAPSLMHCRVQ